MNFLVGTGHVSELSARDVERVITAVRPDAVCVELCKPRSLLMYPLHEDSSEADRKAGEDVYEDAKSFYLSAHPCTLCLLHSAPMRGLLVTARSHAQSDQKSSWYCAQTGSPNVSCLVWIDCCSPLSS